MGFFGGRRVLTIGLPLAAELTLQQLTGILAHEFGHFAQGVGMRAAFVIRGVSGWFARVVYERDSWDVSLERMSHSGGGFGAVVFLIARGCVGMTRGVLYCLMQIGNVMSCFLSRQMEFDADGYEIRLCGSASFAETSRRLAHLSVASSVAGQTVTRTWDERRLADDFVALTSHHLGQLGPEALSQIDEDGAAVRTGALDTHPAHSDRVAAAERLDESARFDLTLPAHVLFDDFEEICREASWRLYRGRIGRVVQESQLVPTADLVGEQQRQRDEVDSLLRYFQGAFDPIRSLGFPDRVSEAGDPRETALAVKAARKKTVDGAPAYRERLRAIARRGGNAVIEPPMLEFESMLAERLTHALSLLDVDKVAARLDGADDLRADATRMLDEARFLAGLVPRARDLQLGVERLHEAARSTELLDRQKAWRRMKPSYESLRRHMADLKDALGVHPYPFDHSAGAVPLRRVVVPRMPRANDVGGLLEAGHAAQEQIVQLHVRVMARLTTLAEVAEQAIGLAPLPEPPAPSA